MFKKQQVSTSKNWQAKRGCKTYPKATLISFPLDLKGETQSSADFCHLLPQSCTSYASALSSAVHNCPSLTANTFLIQPNLSSKYTPTCLLQLKICRSMLVFFSSLRKALLLACLALIHSTRCSDSVTGSFPDPATLTQTAFDSACC